ncbi:MAG TPA: hypothetical protein VEK13_01965 [Thermoplasmata archaeon]|nr:hypothetical protein [Thermoplasmata archaeon]
MSETTGALDPTRWASSVVVRDDPILAAELSARWESASAEKGIAVTDLLGLRRAFWRRTTPPIPLSAERRSRLETGRRVHRALEALLAREGSIEVRVRRQGIVGRIDALTDRPIEVKSTTFAPDPADLIEDRPEYVEQLGWYCALTGCSAGRLITVLPGSKSGPELRTADVSFSDLGAWSREMERRAAQLRASIALGDPSALPRCRWYERGCEYRSGSVCGCVGTEPGDESYSGRDVARVTPRPEVDRALGPLLQESLKSARPSSVGRFRDLLYPRRAFYERKRAEGAEEAAQESAVSLGSTPAAYYRLVQAIEGGPAGEVARLVTRTDEPEEEVTAFRGVPYLARTSRTQTIPRADEILTRTPQYALELGFRCAVTGSSIGRAIVAYERSVDIHTAVRVFEYRFHPMSTFSRIWRNRLALLEQGTALGDATSLPACPKWMHADCPHRSECGCAADLERSQR